MENRKTRLTKRLLKESLIELLNEKEINKITIKEICDNADLNRSTFYAHYTDIYELLDEITQDLISHVPMAEGINTYSISNIEECISYIQENKKTFSVLLELGVYRKYLTRKTSEIFKNGTLQDGAMVDCDIDYYNALSAYCIAGSENFLSYCLQSDIPTNKQAAILYRLMEESRKIVIEYSK